MMPQSQTGLPNWTRTSRPVLRVGVRMKSVIFARVLAAAIAALAVPSPTKAQFATSGTPSAQQTSSAAQLPYSREVHRLPPVAAAPAHTAMYQPPGQPPAVPQLPGVESDAEELKNPQLPGFAPDQPGALQPPPEATEAPEEAESAGAEEAPDQPGFGQRLMALEEKLGAAKLPIVKLSGFFHLDQGLFSQNAQSRAVLGDIQDGVGFRRARLQAVGDLTEFTGFSIEFDFATAGRPSFMDVWGEQRELPFLGTVRIGNFRQPGTMDGWTSIRHLDFLERSAPFQAFDPFRRVGAMSYFTTDDKRSVIAYSVFATGFTFFNGTSTVYNELGGDNRFATQISDRGGVGFASRATRLLWYDEPSEGRYLVHIGGGYDFAETGGNGATSGLDASTYRAATIPEFFVGAPDGGLLTAAGTPAVVDTGRFLANSYSLLHAEIASNYGPAHVQGEWLWSIVNQMNGGSNVFYNGAYLQCGYYLTGESASYNRLAGVLDYNVKPHSPFFGIGRDKGFGGLGAWEVAFRWSYLDLSANNILPINRLPGVAGPPPSPNPGILNESTVALNWYWNQWARMQFNWIHSNVNSNLYGNYDLDTFAGRFQIEF